MRSLTTFVIILLFCQGCGDRVETKIGPLQNLVACEMTSKRAPLAPQQGARGTSSLIATTSDKTFGAGEFVFGSLTGNGFVKEKLRRSRLSTGDALVINDEDSSHFYVLNRLGSDSVQVFTKKEGKRLANFSVGLGTNAQDLLPIGDSLAYVSRLNESKLLRVDAITGGSPCGIDLSFLADGDGIPELSRMVRVGTELWVAVQRLNRNALFSPTNKSYIGVIDLQTERPLRDRTIELVGLNPFSDIKRGVDGLLYVSSVGLYGTPDGGIEAIDSSSHRTLGFIFSEENAGGDILDFELINESLGVAIIQDFPVKKEQKKIYMELAAFNPKTGEKVLTILRSEGALSGLAWNAEANLLYAGDRHSATVRTFAVPSFAEGKSLSLGLAPVSLGIAN